jgi:hypothetical protein
MAKGLDIGTMFLVKSEVDDIAGGGSAFTVERNVFLNAATTDDTEETLKENNWAYAKYDDDFYILGEDAIKLKNLLTIKSSSTNENLIATKISELRRPMQNGILNTSEEKLSVAIIQKLIENLLGKPNQPDETLCFCSPGDPIDSNLSVMFHKTMLTSFLQGLGYSIECIPEAMAIIFSEQPTMPDENEPNGEAKFTGIAFSFGAGMCNVCFAYRQMPLISFSIARSGDWIDREAAKVAGVDMSVITRYKEKNFDLNNVDMSDMRQAALKIFYQNMIEHALRNFAQKFNELENQIDSPLEVIVAGGTASVPGFMEKFNAVLKSVDLPFKVKSARLAENPLYAVSNGCLIKSLAVENKSKNQQDKAPKTAKNK